MMAQIQPDHLKNRGSGPAWQRDARYIKYNSSYLANLYYSSLTFITLL